MARKRQPFLFNSQPLTIDAPGLKLRPRGERVDHYWIPSDEAALAGFTPRTVRLHPQLTFRRQGDTYAIEGTAHEIERLAAQCRDLWHQMLDWQGDPSGKGLPTYDGTLGALIDCYQGDKLGPYFKLTPNTRRGYDGWCRTLRQLFGGRRVDRLTGQDLQDMFATVLKPAKVGGAPRVRMARACVAQMIPILLNYGATILLPGCLDLLKMYEILEFRVPRETRLAWKASRPKKVPMSFEHADAIVTAGLKKGGRRWRSLALGVAAQFEFMLSQIDVIGAWEKIDQATAFPIGAVVRGNRMWRPGLRYEKFAGGVIQDAARSKTSVDLPPFKIDEYPLFMRALAAVPETERHGPMVVNDNGEPMKSRYYASLYARLAKAAGVPAEVWNMRARHGGITEGRESGADKQDLQHHAGHSNFATTDKFYIDRTAASALRVQRKRVASRKRKKIA